MPKLFKLFHFLKNGPYTTPQVDFRREYYRLMKLKRFDDAHKWAAHGRDRFFWAPNVLRAKSYIMEACGEAKKEQETKTPLSPETAQNTVKTTR